MTYLLDTHIWLWMLGDPARIRADLAVELREGRTRLLLSAASSWEIAIKWAAGRLPLPEPPATYVPSRMQRTNVEPLAVTHSHALQVATLAPHHRDPFDRLLVAQSQLEGVPLVTVDRAFEAYDVEMHPRGLRGWGERRHSRRSIDSRAGGRGCVSSGTSGPRWSSSLSVSPWQHQCSRSHRRRTMPDSCGRKAAEAGTPFGKGWPTDFAPSPDGGIVAIGGDGSAMTWYSTDGREWSATYLPGGASADARSIEAVGDRLLAVGHGLGQGLVWTSADGVEWSDPAKVKGAMFERLVVLPDGLAIAGTRPDKDFSVLTVWRSPDGEDWTPSRIDRGVFAHMSDFVVTDDGTWLITGTLWDPETDRRPKNRAWRSADGESWERLKSPGQGMGWDQYTVRDVAGTPSGLVAGLAGFNEQPRTSFGAVLHSADGRTWEPVAELNEFVTSFVETPDGLLALLAPLGNKKGTGFVKNAGHYLASADGLAWADMPADALADNAMWSGIAMPDGRVFAVGSSGPFGQLDTIWSAATDEWIAANPATPEPTEDPAAIVVARTLDDLLAPADGEHVGPAELEDIYRPAWTDTNTIESGNGKLIATIYVPQLSTLGHAFALCDQGSYGDKGTAAKLGRQTGCLLALKLAWLDHLEHMDQPNADERFDQARLAYVLASDRLDAKSLAWLARTSRKTLPGRFDDLPKPPPKKGRKPKANAKTLINSRFRRIPDERILTSIRDAVAADTVSPAKTLEGIAGGLVGHAAAVPKTGKAAHISTAGGCLANMWERLDGQLPKNQYMNGIAPPGPPFNSCWDLTATLWNAYKRTGVNAYKDAAFAVWQDYQAEYPDARPGTSGFKSMSRMSPIR